MVGKTRMISCPEKTRSRHLLQMTLKLVEAVVVVEVHLLEGVRINVEEVNRVAVEERPVAEDPQLLGAVVTLQGRAVVEAEPQPRKIETSGSTSYNISGAKIFCLLVYSSSPRSDVRKMPRRFPTSITVTLQKRARYI
jgi:hypothetical protein